MDYIGTWKEVMFRPSDFYRRMPKDGGYGEPLTFAAINFIISALLTGLLTLLFAREMYMGSMYGGMYGSNQEFGLGSLIVTVIMTPIGGIIGIFIGAAILYIVFKILGGDGTYEGTVRFVSYATAVLVLSWIPIIGWVMGIYGIYLQIVGGMHVHNVSMIKSAIAVLLPAILLFILVVIILGAMLAFVGSLI
jgi:hypothetical protein